jgi:hypothetical protein
MTLKIISGGQSGADMGGLKAARACGIPTGGVAPKDYYMENGANTDLRDVYHLEDIGMSIRERTIENVHRAHATLIFADRPSSPGTKLTLNTCRRFGKAGYLNPDAEHICKLLDKMGMEYPELVVNIAGNRESVAPGIEERTERVLTEAFKKWAALQAEWALP